VVSLRGSAPARCRPVAGSARPVAALAGRAAPPCSASNTERYRKYPGFSGVVPPWFFQGGSGCKTGVVSVFSFDHPELHASGGRRLDGIEKRGGWISSRATPALGFALRLCRLFTGRRLAFALEFLADGRCDRLRVLDVFPLVSRTLLRGRCWEICQAIEVARAGVAVACPAFFL
jgi:hypothetical protein